MAIISSHDQKFIETSSKDMATKRWDQCSYCQATMEFLKQFLYFYNQTDFPFAKFEWPKFILELFESECLLQYYRNNIA